MAFHQSTITKINEYKRMKYRIRFVLMISGTFLLMHIVGLQEQVSVLAGAHSGSGGERLGGYFYVFFYIMMLSLVPIVILSIPLTKILDYWENINK